MQSSLIEPLKKADSYALIKKYDPDGKRSAQLIDRLEENALKGVEEFLKNPLLTTLLYRCYEYKNQIPLKKPIFYRQVYDALYDWHDSSKDGYNTRSKKSNLDIDSFHRVLKALGFICVVQGKVEGAEDEMLQWIRTARKMFPDLSFNESHFLEDAVKAVPVLRRDGNYFRWSHKSLSEYFAALYIVQDAGAAQADVLASMANFNNLPRYVNVIDLIYDIDNLLFLRHFVTPLEQLFQEFAKSSFQGLDSRIPIASIRRRQAVMFVTRMIAFKRSGKAKDTKKVVEKTLETALVEWKIPGLGEKNFAQSWHAVVPIYYLVGGTLTVNIRHPLANIVDILSIKKDALFLSEARQKVEKQTSQIQGIGPAKYTYLSDDPNALWNSLKYFDKVTSFQISMFGGAINVERLLQTPNVISQREEIPNLVLSLIAKSS